ncbi:MAG: hypothetical protein ABII12_11945 [Planctomycetota bacterium]
MDALFCPFINFTFDLAQLVLNLVFLLPGMFGMNAPDLRSGVGSLFGCSI